MLVVRCSENNPSGTFIVLNGELLDKYRNKGFWQSVENAEPVTGIASVSEEREAQAYRFRIEDLSFRREGTEARK